MQTPQCMILFITWLCLLIVQICGADVQRHAVLVELLLALLQVGHDDRLPLIVGCTVLLSWMAIMLKCT